MSCRPRKGMIPFNFFHKGQKPVSKAKITSLLLYSSPSVCDATE